MQKKWKKKTLEKLNFILGLRNPRLFTSQKSDVKITALILGYQFRGKTKCTLTKYWLCPTIFKIVFFPWVQEWYWFLGMDLDWYETSFHCHGTSRFERRNFPPLVFHQSPVCRGSDSGMRWLTPLTLASLTFDTVTNLQQELLLRSGSIRDKNHF